MNDDTTPDIPEDGSPHVGGTEDTARSEAEERALDALRSAPQPALSDLDRRRLVRRAMEATEPTVSGSRPGTATRRMMAVGAAAAVLVLVVVSVSWLSGRSTDEQFADSGAAVSDDPVADALVEEAPETAAGTLRSFDLLDLGTLGNFDGDDDVVIAFDDAGTAVVSSDTSQGFISSTAIACSPALPADFIPLAVGTLTLRGTGAVIFGGEASDGTTVAYLLATSDCVPFDGWYPRAL